MKNKEMSKEKQGIFHVEEYFIEEDFNVEIDGKLTFFGVYYNYLSEIQKFWRKESTKFNYAARYLRIIRAMGIEKHNSTTIENMTIEMLDQAIEKIRLEGKVRKSKEAKGDYDPYNESTLRQFRFAIYKVFDVAYEHELTDLDLTYTDYGKGDSSIIREEAIQEESTSEKKGIVSKKSFTPEEELTIFNALFSNRGECPEKMGLRLMYGMGLRNGECCGLKFGSFKKKIINGKEYMICYVYESTIAGTNTLQIGGKTSNAFREIPVPDRIQKSLADWEEKVKNKFQLSEEQLLRAPVVYREVNGEMEVARARDLTNYAKGFFSRHGFNKEAINEYYQTMIMNADENIKDITTYVFRRNFATHLEILGCTDEESRYLMGHTLRYTSANRNFLSSDESICRMAEKLSRRPFVNSQIESKKELTLRETNRQEVFSDFEKIIIHAPKKGRVVLTFTAKQPSEGIKIKTEKGTELQNVKFIEVKKSPEGEATILKKYIRRHLDLEKKRKNGEEPVADANSKEGENN